MQGSYPDMHTLAMKKSLRAEQEEEARQQQQRSEGWTKKGPDGLTQLERTLGVPAQSEVAPQTEVDPNENQVGYHGTPQTFGGAANLLGGGQGDDLEEAPKDLDGEENVWWDGDEWTAQARAAA